MKTILLTLMIFVGGILSAQTAVTLRINHEVQGNIAQLFSNYTDQNNQEFYFDRFEYYLCEFSLTHDGGQTTNLTDAYVLANFSENDYELGEFDIQDVESISFSVGVDADVNHDDPASWPSDHPLAPQNPSMHWGWASGYRFAAIEGKADNSGNGSPNAVFEFHVVGDEFLTGVSLDVESFVEDEQIIIEVYANYLNCFGDVNLSTAGIHHGGGSTNQTIMDNFSESVFSAESSVSIEEMTNVEPDFFVYPNPSNGIINVDFNADVKGTYSLSVYSLSGELVYSIGTLNISNELRQFEIDLPSGLYVLELTDKSKMAMRAKLTIQ